MTYFREENRITFSVCMASYNGMKYLHQQLESILSQLRDTDELIIIDDVSNDGTYEYLASLDDNRIKLYRNHSNLGFIKTFQNALYHATNDVIILSDQDDIWLSHKISFLCSAFSIPSVSAVFSNHFLIDENSLFLQSLYFKNLWVPRLPLVHTYAHGPGISFRSSYLKKILPFPSGIKSHDQWIGQLLSVLTLNILFTKVPLELYRRHSSQFTHNIKASVPIHQKLLNRYVMLSSIFKRVLFE